MHSLLERQIKEHLGSAENIPKKWQAFVHAVDETYQQTDAGLAELVDVQGRELLDVIQSVALGDLGVQVEIPEGVEVLSDLAIGLEMMIDDIREMIAEQVQAREEVERARQKLDAALQQVLSVQRRYIKEGWQSYTEERSRTTGYALADGQEIPPTDAWLPAMAVAVEKAQVVTSEDDNGSVLAWPLEFYDQVFGVLGFARDAEEGWSESELSTVRAVIEQVTQALENQRLLDEQQHTGTLMAKRVEELDCLGDIGRKLDESPAVPELLTWVTARIPAAMQYAGECLVAAEFEGQVYGSPEAQTLPRQMVQGMRVGGELVGRLYVAYTQERNFLNEESALLGDVARRISGYIESRQLIEATQANAEQLGVLYELAQTLTARLDMDQLLEQVYRGVSRLVDANNFYVALYDPQNDEMSFPLAIENGQRRRWGVRRGGNGLSEYVIRTRQPCLIRGSLDQHAERFKGVQQIGQMSRSWAGVPMIVGDQVMGVMAVQSEESDTVYDEHDLELLSAIAGQASVALQNARLFEATQANAEQFRVLYELAQSLTTRLEMDQVLDQVYRGVSRLMNATNFYIGLYEPERDRISFPLNVTESVADRKITVIPAGSGISGYIVSTGQSVLIGESVDLWMQGHGIEVVGENAKCFLGVPLLIGDQVQGLIAVQDYHRANVYTERDQAMLTAIAGQASVAIQNARLFAQMRERARREQILRQIASRVRSSTDPDVIVRAAVRELGTALGRRAFVRLGSVEELAQPPQVSEI
ncbi:MAG: GAF domain-containing protein [Anaerolineae bacterium]|nr:GAF domain-containing protein [Anaerolineae bacterium]